MTKKNHRNGRRKNFDQKYIVKNLENGIHYVYALVSRENRFVGYFGVTDDPKSRAWQHKKDAVRKDSRRSKWLDNNPSPPELVVLGAFPSRDVAEIVERCLIRNFNAAGILTNGFKYFNRQQERKQLVLDDIPFWSVDADAEFVE